VTGLDVADVVVIAGRVLGIGTDAALAQADLEAASAALASAAPASAGRRPGRDAAATSAIELIQALLEHPPFPRHREVVAVAAGLQYLSVSGWSADLDPPGPAAVVVEALAAGRLGTDAAARWLAPRLAPHRILTPRRVLTPRREPTPRRGRLAAPAAVMVAAGGLTLLATACAHGPMNAAQVSYSACMRSHGVRGFPDPSASGVIVVDASTGISRDSAAVESARRACADDAHPAVKWSRRLMGVNHPRTSDVCIVNGRNSPRRADIYPCTPPDSRGTV
jgi:hypothetical protein